MRSRPGKTREQLRSLTLHITMIPLTCPQSFRSNYNGNGSLFTEIVKQSEKSGHPAAAANSKVMMEQLLGNSMETFFTTTTTVKVETNIVNYIKPGKMCSL